jgi:hypothetical protein
MPFPCRSRNGFRLCLSNFIYTVRPCLIHPCHGMCELASAVQSDLPTFGFFHEGYQKHTKQLNCTTSTSDISGCHAEFHEGHGIVGKLQGRGMARVNNAARHGRGMACMNCPIWRHGIVITRFTSTTKHSDYTKGKWK